MAAKSKTIPPFEAPEFFSRELRQKNGGQKGLRAMRRAWAELHNPKSRIRSRHPLPRQIRAKGEFTRSAIEWARQRAVELLIESSTRFGLLTTAG